MGKPEHISGPIKRVLGVLEVVYSGIDYDEAIERKLRELGLRPHEVRVIIAVPKEMANQKSNAQLSLF
jgi:hypothetical protein